MAQLVTRVTKSGVVAVEETVDDTGLGRALKEIDDRYVLQWWPPYHKVFCIVSEDQPAIPILTWCDEQGEPLPLTWRLVDEVKKWRPEARARRGPDADERNRQLLEQNERNRQAKAEAIAEDHAAGIVHGRTSVSMGPGPRKPGWQRHGVRPSSGGGRP
jgi:hypothetical protein